MYQLQVYAFGINEGLFYIPKVSQILQLSEVSNDLRQTISRRGIIYNIVIHHCNIKICK